MRDQSAREPGLMDASEIVNRVIAAIMLATLTGLAGAVLASQMDQPAAANDYREPDRVGTRGTDQQGRTITGGTDAATAGGGGATAGTGTVPVDTAGEPFLVSELATTPGAWPPGSSQLRWIRITNPGDTDIVVTRLSATVGLPVVARDAPDLCLPADLTVEPLAKPVAIAAGGRADVTLVTRLSDNAPASCVDAIFPLSYAGVASTG